ncbi:hypothetical protein C8F04DRAFT_1284878, partial [Mycena alexandri]
RRREAEVRRKQEEEEEARHEQEAEVRRKQEEEKEARISGRQKSRGREEGRKRRLWLSFVPEEAGAERRTGRKRLTPEEARWHVSGNKQRPFATAKKPSYEYVEKSPVKAQSTRNSDLSCAGT